MKLRGQLFVFLLFTGFFSNTLYGQARTGTILGTVRDSAGAVIPGAAVTITDQETNKSRTVSTDASGRYFVPALPIGKYTIKVTQPGFAEGVVKDLILEVQDNREVDFTLSLAAVGQQIEVTADVLEVERTTAALGQVIHARQVADLPLNGRNFVQLGWLAPGVVKGEGTFLNNRGNTEVSIRGSVSLSVQGMRENTNDWLLDGVDNNELTAGAISILPSVDAIQEFKVLTYNYSAEYGSRSSATVLVITKGGSNQLHGTLFEFFRNDILDARNFFDGPSKGKLRQNQFGGSIGGPIRKDKTFFFGDYQGFRVRQGLTFLSTVPTLAMRNGDFNESFPDAPRRLIFDPSTTRTDPTTGALVRDPFLNNVITRVDPIGKALLDLFPLPNITSRLFGNFLSNPVRRFDQNSFNVRIDQSVSSRDQLFGRFSFDHATQFFPNGLPGFGSGPSAAFSTCNFKTDARNVGLHYTHTFSATKTNQLILGYNRVFNNMRSIGQGTNKAREIGIPGANLGDFETSGLTNIGISGGFNRLGDRLFTPFLGGTNVYHLANSFLYVRGSHRMKIGGSVRLMQMPVIGNTWPAGNFNFDNLFTARFTAAGALDGSTGHPIASLLLGLPTSGSRNNHFDGWENGRRWGEYRWYFEDGWQVTSNLSLTAGLAYNLTTPQREDHNRFTNFDTQTGRFLIAGQNAGRSAGVETDKDNFEPRIGLAWSPLGSKTTVIRAGYGVFHDVSANGGVQGLYLNPPFADAFAFQSNNITPVRALATGFPIIPRPDLATFRGNLVIQQLDYQQGLVQQWNVNVQRQLPGSIVLTLAYAGTSGTHLQSKGWNTNSATPGPGFNPASRRPFPQFNNFNAILSRGQMDYHALQMTGEKRLSHGLYFLSTYTWSKAFSNGLRQNIGVNQGVTYFPLPVSRTADKGFSDTDIRHNFSLSYIYDLPFGRGRMFLGDLSGIRQKLLGDWQISGIVKIRSGFPLALSTSVDQSGAGVGNRPNRTCDGELPTRTVERWLDASCFVLPAPGTLGNSARTVLSGPGQVNFDFSVAKTFPVKEGADVQFRSEIFNIFNHAQFDVPAQLVGAAGLGRITATINTSRQIQFGLKIRY